MLFLDTSALVKRYVEEDGTELVLRLMDQDPRWAVSAIARTEVTAGIDGEPDADLRADGSHRIRTLRARCPWGS